MTLIRGFLFIILFSTLSACSTNFLGLSKNNDSNQKQAKQESTTEKKAPSANKTATAANDTKKDAEDKKKKPRSFFGRIANSDFFSIDPKRNEKKANKDGENPRKSYFGRLFNTEFFRITRSTDIERLAGRADDNTIGIDIEKDAARYGSESREPREQIDWSTAVSYRQWRDARNPVETTSVSNPEYQEYLQWLEFQKLKSQR